MDVDKHVQTVYETQKWFTDASRDILLKPENLQKTHWRDCEEMFLLEQLTRKVDAYTKEPNKQRELKLLFDISNFSMMLADRLRQDYFDSCKAEELGG